MQCIAHAQTNRQVNRRHAKLVEDKFACRSPQVKLPLSPAECLTQIAEAAVQRLLHRRVGR